MGKMSHVTNSIKHHHHQVNRSSVPGGPAWPTESTELVSGGETSAHSLPTHHHHAAAAAKEELRQRELEEARARAAQMEKTMRWWSDCTANWREKWSKVRTERNKAREEARQLRTKLEALSKECATLRKEKQDIEEELNQFRMVSPSVVPSDPTKREPTDSKKLEASTQGSQDAPGPVTSTQDDSSFPTEVNQVIQAANEDLEFLDKLLQKNGDDSRNGEKAQPSSEESLAYNHKLSMLQYKLEEAMKTIENERLEKQQLLKTLENLQNEQNKKENDIETSLGRLPEEDTVSLDEKITELRAQLERFQWENATEWARREQLETDKQALERENKQLRTQISDLEERIARKSKQVSSAASDLADAHALQLELCEKNKELSELKYIHTKLKKVLQDKSTELTHALRRSEQYEAEVKKLRSRIEELKKDLASAEDEVDNANNALRKLQRTKEELQDQVDSLRIQMEHLESRLRKTSSQLLLHPNHQEDPLLSEEEEEF